jgi:hypothetical protein
MTTAFTLKILRFSLCASAEMLQDSQFLEAGVAELADARDSKSRSFGSVGSIPSTGI